MKKKVIIPLLSSLFVLGLASCGSNNDTASSAPDASSSVVDDGTFNHSEVTKDSTVAEIIAWCEAQSGSATDNTYLYKVTGIMEGWNSAKATDDYGNWYLTSEDGAKSIKVYGSTNQTTGQKAFTRSNGVITWKNPKTAKTTLANYSDGSVVTMIVQRLRYNSTYEIQGYIVDGTVSKTTLKVAASIGTPENGTASIDKTTNITYGDTVTVTVAPATGYVVEAVAVKTLYGTINATKATDTTYTFAASCKNEVTVTFAVPSGGVEIDMAKAELTLTNGSYTTEGVTLSSFVNFAYNSSYKEYVLAKSVEEASFVISFASATKITFYQYGKYNNFGVKKVSKDGEKIEGFTDLADATKFSTNSCKSTSLAIPTGVTSVYVYNNSEKTDGKLKNQIGIYGIVVE